MSSLSGQNITGSGQYDAQDSSVESSLSGQTSVLTEEEISRLVARLAWQAQFIQAPVGPAPPTLNQPFISPPPRAPVTGSFPVLPPFPPASGSSFNGESLFYRFPLIKSSVIIDITRHEFESLDLVKLDPAQDRSSEYTPISHDDYPTFNSLLKPLVIYFEILFHHAIISGDSIAASFISRGSVAYIRNLSALHGSYQWTGVLEYHRDFFLLRRREMKQDDYSGWGRMNDPELVDYHLRLVRRV